MPDLSKAQKALKLAMKKFQNRDADLVKFDASARAMMTRLAMYLQNELGYGRAALDVDCEYNRQGRGNLMPFENTVWIPRPDDQPKVGMDIERIPAVIYKPMRVFPDIVVHRRDDRDANVLVIEIKKSDHRAGATDIDRERLSVLTLPRTKKGLGYQLGVLLVIWERGGKVQITPSWFKNGKNIDPRG